MQGLQALQPNNNTKLIIKKTILKNKQNYTIYDDINGTSFEILTHIYYEQALELFLTEYPNGKMRRGKSSSWICDI